MARTPAQMLRIVRRRRPRVLPPLPRLPLWRVRLIAILGVLGPGLVSGFADNDAGGITTYSLAGAQWGYTLLWVILASQIVLFFTQEVGARLGLATGKGLIGLIRERWGVRWATFAALAMLAANLGCIVAEFAGIASALGLFGIPAVISAGVAAVVVIGLIALGNYSRIQYLFVGVGIFVSIAYVISAQLAGPDWTTAFQNLAVPHLVDSPLYWLSVVGTVGTTITPWGQAFIQSYVADKGLKPDDLAASRIDVFFGALLTNLIAAFIVVACAATLWAHGETSITSAADAARALRPLAGDGASLLFAVGLLGASFLGLGVVPMTSAYTTCEAFGWETGVDWKWREAPAFYGLLAFFIGFAALFVMIPGLPLITVMFSAQVLNAILLPFILVFVMLLAGDRALLGPLASGRFLLTIGWASTIVLILLSGILVVTGLGII
ncbi:MAG TPA: Nramp family divalent metal transporter [Candidatus Limnocylindrales bacterium]|nr:Nramp family divalent metal transporter [Candidatus Limnocylindrales bacterium]